MLGGWQGVGNMEVVESMKVDSKENIDADNMEVDSLGVGVEVGSTEVEEVEVASTEVDNMEVGVEMWLEVLVEVNVGVEVEVKVRVVVDTEK